MEKNGADEMAHAQLVVIATDLAAISSALGEAGSGGALSWPLADVFARLAVAIELCEEIVRGHADGSAPVSNDTLREVATVLRRSSEVAAAFIRPAVTATHA